MGKFTISFDHVLKRRVTCEVIAEDKEEALEKAIDGDYESSDEESTSEESIALKIIR